MTSAKKSQSRSSQSSNKAMAKSAAAVIEQSRPTRHTCATCGNGGIPFNELQMVRVGQPGGHTTMQPNHRKCFAGEWPSAK